MFNFEGSQYFLDGFPVLGLPDERRGVKYFSLNPFLPDQRNRCPLECSYCVCHQDDDWHHSPELFAGKTTPDDLIDLLLDNILSTEEGQRGFPISLFDYSDPFLPVHQQGVLTTIENLIARGADNMVYITTKYQPEQSFLNELATLLSGHHKLRPTIFVSLPPLRSGYEKVSVDRRIQLIKDLKHLGLACCWYLRPLAEQWFDEKLLWELARALLPAVPDHIILSGVVMSPEIECNLRSQGLDIPDWHPTETGVKQPLAPAFEARIRQILQEVAVETSTDLGPVMSHRLCGTNGNHAYGCLICGKNDRFCQLFQIHHYGQTLDSDHNDKLKNIIHRSSE